MKISFCEYNENKDEVITILKEKYPQFESSVTRCIFSCGECSEKLIVRINGELLSGECAEDLIEKILDFQSDHPDL